jgi:hypothetical protein
MLPEMKTKEHPARTVVFFYVLAILFMILMPGLTKADAAVKQKGFASPEDAVKAFAVALKANDKTGLSAIFGPDGKGMISSGDPVSDKVRTEKFIKALELKHSLVPDGKKMVLIVGDKDWPFAIPLAQKGDQWFFDTKAGRQEMLNRRIGENELDTIQTMLAIVDAEREYVMKDRDANGLLEYAEKFMSDPGKKNGLYWETKEGEEKSPLGEFVADARAEGYSQGGVNKKPIPYHGYYFRMLKKQGKHAPEGAFDYVVNGKQIGGFAVVAYPATYGSSGVMTFIVNHDGVVYQKDLGKNTAKTAKAMKVFDPDSAWKKVK